MEPERIAQLVRKNDNDSRHELFMAYYRRTYAVAYNILRRHENAEDITQDAFIKAFQNLHQLQDKEKFGAWLAVIASNLARNHLKREKKMIITDEMPAVEAAFAPLGTEEEALRSLDIERVRRAIRALPPEQYQVVVLQYYYDLKVDEIAAMLKIRSGTVKSRLFRARQKLAALLELDSEEACLLGEGGDRERCPEKRN